MDFQPVAADTAHNLDEIVAYVLLLDVSPADKRSLLTEILLAIGVPFRSQMYDAASEVFDSGTITSIGFTDELKTKSERLAIKLMRQYALGRVIFPIVQEYCDMLLADAEHEAFLNANSLQKHPTLTRSIVSETCQWCDSLAGTHTDPDPKYFARHDNCDCLIVVSGYNTRNGILRNYRKKE